MHSEAVGCHSIELQGFGRRPACQGEGEGKAFSSNDDDDNDDDDNDDDDNDDDDNGDDDNDDTDDDTIAAATQRVDEASRTAVFLPPTYV